MQSSSTPCHNVVDTEQQLILETGKAFSSDSGSEFDEGTTAVDDNSNTSRSRDMSKSMVGTRTLLEF
jgi:hypothetical protein